MSNKPGNLKKPKNEFVHIGNFHVSFPKSQFRYVKIAVLSGHWSITFREDNPLFGWVSNEIKTPDGRNILHIVFAAYYAVCNGVPDNIFFEDILKVYQNSIERMTVAKQELSENEDKQIIEDENEKYNTLKNVGNDTRN